LDHDTNGQVNSSIIEGLQLEASPGTWSREKTKGFRSCGGPFPFQDEDEKMKSMEPTRRLVQGHLLKRNEPVFSPLVLDPGEDMHSFIHSKQSFILEEPFHHSNEVYDSTDEAAVNGYGTCERKPSARPRTHRLSSHESRTQRQLPGNMSNGGKKMQMLSSSASYMAGKRRHLSIRPIALESDLFDHDSNKIEWPFEKDGGLQHPSTHSKKPDTRHLFTGRENFGLPPDSRSSAKLKGGLSSKVQPLQLHKQSKRVSHPAIKTEVDPFPIFPELEGYNGSDDELVASSNGGTSMGALEGELDLEPYNDVPDGHNTGRIVGLGNVGECQLAIPDGKELIICEYKPRNLSQKYRPKVFEDMVGQRIVTQALSNALSKGKIAPVYLFQGSRGTGKTTAARIFASALLCLSNDMQKPCGVCKECIGVFQSTCPEVREVDAASNNGIERVKALLEETMSANRSLYKVFIIEECHVLATETWNALLKILEEPPMNVVFILITTDPDRLPRTVVSRCHKFLFPKIRDSDIVTKLQKLAALENLAVDAETLQLIASRSDGSLRDAEIMLDQVSLLGQQINSSTVQELVLTSDLYTVTMVFMMYSHSCLFLMTS
jgi:DNA polymerase III subunit gamma/tau